MKINPEELKQIIKEEAIRLKRKMMLEAEKTSILKQLQEMEECDMMQEDMINEISAQEIQANMQKLSAAIDNLINTTMQQIQANPKYAGRQITQDQVFSPLTTKELVMQKAKADNYAGTVKRMPGQRDKRYVIVYTPAPPTGLAKFGAAVGSAIRGGHTFGGGA